ncbi:MAG: PilX N-terminal domain-containing pilus assembly protein [Terriglobales bacterium]
MTAMRKITARIQPAYRPRGNQRGVALFIGLVFLVVLSLVAVIAMQSTLLEMHMVTNVARQAEAFQMSESGRSILTAPTQVSLFSQSLELAGWPASWGGDVPDNDFDMSSICAPLAAPCPLVIKFEAALLAAHGSPPKLLYGAFDSPGADGTTDEVTDNPSNWVTDATLSLTDPQDSTSTLTAALSVVPDGAAINAGAGAAQAAGYRGLGVGLAAGGASRYFQIQSVATAPGNARAVTIAQYKAVVQ